jgi:putative PIN family toxin of toxin-antitoxin system
MREFVLDTNILVSALWTPNGNAARILDVVKERRALLCYSNEIFAEYARVLPYPKLRFDADLVHATLELVKAFGILVAPVTLPDVFADPTDKPFWELAVFRNIPLITGNTKHFPADSRVLTPAAFVQRLEALD